MLVSLFTGATKRSFRPVRGNTQNHPITYSRPSQLSPRSTPPGSTLTRPCVNSSVVSTRPRVNLNPGQLELGSTRPRVNSNSGQLVPESTCPRVNSPRVNSSPSQLVPVPHFVPESTRPRVNSPRVNSSSSQLVPVSTRPRVNSRLHLSLVNLHPRQLAPTSTRTLVIPQPSQLAHRSTRTQVPAYHTTHLPIYLHYLPPT